MVRPGAAEIRAVKRDRRPRQEGRRRSRLRAGHAPQKYGPWIGTTCFATGTAPCIVRLRSCPRVADRFHGRIRAPPPCPIALRQPGRRTRQPCPGTPGTTRQRCLQQAGATFWTGAWGQMLGSQASKRKSGAAIVLIQIKGRPTSRDACLKPAQFSRSFNRCTLPEGPLGSASTSLMTFGFLYWPSSRSEKAASSSTLHANPGFSTTQAMISWP